MLRPIFTDIIGAFHTNERNPVRLYELEGTRQSLEKEFDSQGNIIFEGTFQDGKREGPGKEYNIYGNLIFEGVYRNGARWEGHGKQLDIHGNVIYEGIYKNGKHWEGIGRKFDSDGKIVFEGTYKDDERSEGHNGLDSGIVHRKKPRGERPRHDHVGLDNRDEPDICFAKVHFFLVDDTRGKIPSLPSVEGWRQIIIEPSDYDPCESTELQNLPGEKVIGFVAYSCCSPENERDHDSDLTFQSATESSYDKADVGRLVWHWRHLYNSPFIVLVRTNTGFRMRVFDHKRNKTYIHYRLAPENKKKV